MISTCHDLIAALGDYVDQSWSAVGRATVDGHLQHCPYCRDYLRTYVATAELCHLLATPAPEPAGYQQDEETAVLSGELVDEIVRRFAVQS
jgi:predicted anti-sigma-YlaC factor YlaD